MAQKTNMQINTSQTQPIPIPGHGKRVVIPLDMTQSPVSDAGSDASSYYESALDEDDAAFDNIHVPSHHRRNALSFENGFEFPVFLHRRM